MKDAYYFPHDSNAIQDPKMMTLLFECGAYGIGLFWIIIEIMHQQESGTITSEQLTQYLEFYGKQAAWDEHLLNKCRTLLFKTKLLISKEDFVYSERVLLNKQKRDELSHKRSIAGLISANKRIYSTSVEQVLTSVEQVSTKERKGKERKETLVADATTPKPLTEIQKIVTVYKLVSGYPKEDTGWDKINFARCAKSAKSLLDFMGNWKDAGDCIQDVYEKLTGKGLTVTLETVVKHASDWKKDKQEKGNLNGILSLPSHGSIPSN